MTIEHKNISNADIHDPKDFSAAPASTVLSKSSTGSLEWVPKDDIGGSQGPVGPAGSLATIQVADASNPVELNALSNDDFGNTVIVEQVTASQINIMTLYTYDSDASLYTANAPYIMTTSKGGDTRWIAAQGAYEIAGPISTLSGDKYITTPQSGALDAIASTGVYDGGVLSVGTPNTTFSISDGSGYIVDNTTDPANPTITPITWTGKTNIAVTNIATQLITFISIDVNGDVVQQSSRWSAAETRDNIILGVVVHVDKTIVDTVNNEHHVTLDVANQVGDVIEGLGFINLDGNVYSPNGANLNIDKSAGTMMGHGVNYYNNKKNPHKLTLAGLTALSFQYRFSNGDNGVTGAQVDPDNLDDGAGGLTALANNKWAIQRIYSFTSNNVKIQRGVTSYDSKDQAIAGIATEPYVTEPSIATNGMLRGFMVIKKGATDLSGTSEAEFLEASKFQTAGGANTGIASTLQSAYDNSTPSPEILTNATNGAVSIQRGSAADTDDVLEIKNGGGTQKSTIKGNGEINTSGQAYSKENALADGANISSDMALGNVKTVTLAGNRTLDNPTNLKAGATYLWIIKQDVTGSRTLAYGTAFKWAGGTAPTLTTTANAVDIISGVSDGTNIYVNIAQDFS
jgi:hypothetical protein